MKTAKKGIRAIKKACREMAHEMMLLEYRKYDDIWWNRIRITPELIRQGGKEIVQEINLKMPNLLSRSPLVDTVDLVAEKFGFESISDLLDYLRDYKPRGPVEERYYEQFLAEALEGGAAAAASQEEPVPPMIEVDEVPC